jgi:hypothetical protein
MPYRSGRHYQARPAESRLAIVASDSGGGRQFSNKADLETKEWSDGVPWPNGIPWAITPGSQILPSVDLFRPTIGLEFGLVDRFANGSDLFLGQLNLAGLRIGDGLVGIASADQRV